MSVHNVQSEIEEAGMTSTVNAFRTPEGLVLGAGKTVGNGIEGWVPNAIFIHTDGIKSTRWYRNTGSVTSATWAEIYEVGALDNINFLDNASALFGTGNDIKVLWNGTYLVSSPNTGMWAEAPSPLDPDPYKAVTLFDDFIVATNDETGIWTELDDGATGTNTHGDQAGGSLNVVTAAVDNDYHAMQSISEAFDLVNAKALWFEARFRLVEANTNESAWWFGLSNTDTTGGFQANAAGPLASYDGVLIWKDEGTMSIDAETSNAASKDQELNIATFVTNTWTRVGFFVSGAATTGVCTPYFNVAGTGDAMTAHSATMNITRAGMEPMHVVFGVKAGPTAGAETLEVDYVKCVQLR
jgi:hypothetical protein